MASRFLFTAAISFAMTMSGSDHHADGGRRWIISIAMLIVQPMSPGGWANACSICGAGPEDGDKTEYLYSGDHRTITLSLYAAAVMGFIRLWIILFNPEQANPAEGEDIRWRCITWVCCCFDLVFMRMPFASRWPCWRDRFW